MFNRYKEIVTKISFDWVGIYFLIKIYIFTTIIGLYIIGKANPENIEPIMKLLTITLWIEIIHITYPIINNIIVWTKRKIIKRRRKT